jgi:hypothetical protein
MADTDSLCDELGMASLSGQAVGRGVLDVRGGDNDLCNAGTSEMKDEISAAERRGYEQAISHMRRFPGMSLEPHDLCVCGKPKREPIPEGSHYVTPCCRQTVVSCCGDV